MLYNHQLQCHLVKKYGIGPAGFAVGVIHIESPYAALPGNILNATTFQFPVLYECVSGVSSEDILTLSPKCESAVLDAALRLQEKGVAAIVGACGSFANFQGMLTRELDIPVFASSMVLANLLLSALPKNKTLAIFFADKRSLSDRLLEECQIAHKDRIRLVDARGLPEFERMLAGERDFDNAVLSNDVLLRFETFFRDYDDIGAVIIQCNELSPYRGIMQKMGDMPIVDATVLLEFVHNSITRMQSSGFLLQTLQCDRDFKKVSIR